MRIFRQPQRTRSFDSFARLRAVEARKSTADPSWFAAIVAVTQGIGTTR
jgi:hypothetical protein